MKLWKYAACLIATALAAAGLSIPAAAQETFSYTILDDGTAAVTCNDTAVTDVQIPAEIDGYPVSALAEDCFKDCTALKNVTFPETLTSISDYGFHNCTSLESVVIPAQIEQIGSFVFEGCTALTEIQVNEENPSYCTVDGVLFDEAMTQLIRYPAAKSDENYHIPDACTSIAPWSFTDCVNLRQVGMTNVTAIGADAFFCAASLESAVLSEGIQELIGPTFAYCTSLRSIVLPSTLRVIGENCFYGCVSLQNARLPDGLQQIGEMAFYGCVEIKEMTVPASVRSIGSMGIGYSVDPETNENAVIEGFRIKTVSGSKAYSYARRNKIDYYAPLTRTATIIILIGVLALVTLAVSVYIVYRNRQKQAALAAAQAAAEKRARRQERKHRKK